MASTPTKSSATRAAERKAQALRQAKLQDSQPEPAEYSGQSRIYSLYDQGLNARLLGDKQTALSRLAQATELAKDSKLSPTMRAEAQYELGRAAQSQGEPGIAIDAYIHCLRQNPRYTEASVQLASLFVRSGKPLMALMTAREAAQRSPNDARVHMVLALVLANNGFSRDARAEREWANRLTNGEGRVPEPALKNESVPGTQPAAPVPGEPGEDDANNQNMFEPEGRAQGGPMLVPLNGKLPPEPEAKPADTEPNQTGEPADVP